MENEEYVKYVTEQDAKEMVVAAKYHLNYHNSEFTRFDLIRCETLLRTGKADFSGIKYQVKG